jgi:NADH:ubiquinone oxidoreductase subunit H
VKYLPVLVPYVFLVVILWLGGYNFDTRNFWVAWSFAMTTIPSVMMFFLIKSNRLLESQRST